MKSKKTMIQKEALLKPRFGSVYRTGGSQYLYLSFYYFKERLRFPTDRIDTPENYAELVAFMSDVGTKVRQGTLQFAKVFYWLDEATKRHFSELEGRDFKPLPEHVTFGEFAETWMRDALPKFLSPTKRTDFEDPLNSRVLPHFKDMPFASITALVVNDFIDGIKRQDRSKGILKRNSKVAKPLSVKRIKHIVAPLKAIWEAACIDYNWTLKNPFEGLKTKYNELRDKSAQEQERQAYLNDSDELAPSTRDVLLLADWQKLKAATDPHYHVVLELLLLGMIGSELEALQKRHLQENSLQVRCAVMKVRIKGKDGVPSRSERHLKFKPKNWYRKRDIQLTARLKSILDKAAARSVSAEDVMFDNGITVPANQFILTMKDGSPFNYTSFRKTVWDKAVKAAVIDMRVPYSLRHTLVQWALLLGMTKTRLVDLMGHCDKTMIDRVYGQYRKGLVEEKELILEYLGEDFLALEELKVSFPERYRAAMKSTGNDAETTKAPEATVAFGQSFGQSQRLFADNYLM